MYALIPLAIASNPRSSTPLLPKRPSHAYGSTPLRRPRHQILGDLAHVLDWGEEKLPR